MVFYYCEGMNIIDDQNPKKEELKGMLEKGLEQIVDVSESGIPEFASGIKAEIDQTILEDRVSDARFIGDEDTVYIDTWRYKTYVNGVDVEMASTGVRLLWYLMLNASEVCEHMEIHSNVWHDDPYIHNNNIKKEIQRIREKLRSYRDFIQTSPGFGYIYTGPFIDFSADEPASNVPNGDISIEGFRSVRKNGELIKLTLGEFRIFETLITNPDRVFEKNQLVQKMLHPHVGDNLTYNTDKLIKVYIYNIRKKLDDDAQNPEYIGNVRGVGYYFIPQVK